MPGGRAQCAASSAETARWQAEPQEIATAFTSEGNTAGLRLRSYGHVSAFGNDASIEDAQGVASVTTAAAEDKYK
jgi:hypothetical protein